METKHDSFTLNRKKNGIGKMSSLYFIKNEKKILRNQFSIVNEIE